jgi:acylphosphatase
MAKLLRIHGRVQGVGFRETMRYQAERLGIGGWVRNRRDGSVEAVVDGESDAVQAIIAWARVGPRSAHIVSVDVSDHPGTFTDFQRLPTE